MTRYAELSADGQSVLCGDVDLSGHRCNTVLGTVEKITSLNDGIAAEHRYLALAVDWRDDGDCYSRHGVKREQRAYSPVRRGHERTLGGRWISALKAFGFDKPYRCPHCNLLITIDPVRLGIEEVPLDIPPSE